MIASKAEINVQEKFSLLRRELQGGGANWLKKNQKTLILTFEENTVAIFFRF